MRFQISKFRFRSFKLSVAGIGILSLAIVAGGVALLAWGQVMPNRQNTQMNSDTQGSRQSDREQRRMQRRQQRNRDQRGQQDPQDTTQTMTGMSNLFWILTQRSIFFHGHFVPPMTTAYEPPSESYLQQQRLRHQEDSLVFNGATVTDGKIEAFLADSDSGNEIVVQVGDSVALGKITDISLNELDYQRTGSGNSMVHVTIGHNLNGYNMWEATTLPSTLPTDNGVDSDVLARMRARRLKELRGGG
ncbi:MAG TPA: hypothetical protein VL992_16615 [Tepidisphaeraceae bacterium]|nr:hypothetical protein [Tepidisphaeraceae bacterium]